MPEKNEILVAALYKFVEISDLLSLQDNLYNICEENNIMGTILIADEGINGTISGKHNEIKETISSLTSDDRFSNIEIKYSSTDKQPFHRMKVRLKKEIISLGRKDINPREMTGERISPEALKNILDSKEEVLVLDTRNEYETRVGKFENAIDLQLDTFRDFPEAVESLPEEYKDKQIVMYCTGGIRCEKASAVMMKAGFADVKQLDGGVIEYFKETGGAYWEGDCFVFDERVALDKELNETEYIYCYICREPLSAEEKASPDFKINEHCPYCINSNS